MTGRAAAVRSSLRAAGHHARVSGEAGPPIVLLHSLGLDGREFGLLVPHLTPDFLCVAVDLLGHGDDSSVAPTLPEMAAAVADAVARVASAAGEPVHLVGHSMGGAVAVEVAGSPAPVASLALVGTPPRGFPVFAERGASIRTVPRSAVIQETLERWFRPQTLRLRTAPIAYARGCLRSMPASVWESAWTSFASWEGPDGRLAGLPVGLVAGDEDVSTPAAAMAALLPGVEPVVIPAAAHMLPLEQPAALAERLRTLTLTARQESHT